MKRHVQVAITLGLLLVAGQANAAVLGGNPTIERSTADGAENALFFDFTSPISHDGTIESWRIYASSTHFGPGDYNITSDLAQLKLKIFRDIGDTWQFIGESPLETVTAWGAVNSFTLPTPIDVLEGDIIAWYYPVGTTPSIAHGWSGGTELVNNSWRNVLIGDIDYDIPDLIDNPDWNGGNWGILHRTYSIQVLGTCTPLLPGDANLDCKVDVSDLGILATHYGTIGGAEWADADFNGDEDVDVTDLGILATYYGTGTATATPEPGMMTLLAFGVVAMLIRRRR